MIESSKSNEFVFSPKYRVQRHIMFWIVQALISGAIWFNSFGSLEKGVFSIVVWIPPFILYCYPLVYWVYPEYLLKEKYIHFTILMLTWAIGGWLLNGYFRAFLFIPLQSYLHIKVTNKNPWQQGTFLLMNATAGVMSMITLFKFWMIKQWELMQSQQEKIATELQLLKAQVQPNFILYTLNNIHTFSLENSPKTPALILKLSSLLSYMLYDCKAEEVLLEKEIEVMKNYIDLEKERYGNKIETSLNIEGDIKDQYIAPLLLMPFLENVFKHGTSDLLEKPWFSLDVIVKKHTIRCKIVNSKTDTIQKIKNGMGIENIKKRLGLLYPDKFELKMNSEEDFFAVSLLIELNNEITSTS